MASEPDELRAAREEARLAREEAERLRQHARELEHRLRDDERRAESENRDLHRNMREAGRRAAHHAFGSPPPPRGPGRPEPPSAEGAGVRDEQPLNMTGVRTVNINQTAGKVTVRICAEGETAAVTTASNKTLPNLEVNRSGDRLDIEVKLSVGWLFRRRTGASTLIRLAPGFADLKVNLGAGEINIQQVACENLNLSTGAGEIKTYATSASLRADTGAGTIQINGHRGLARCDSGTGDVSIDIAELVAGEYRANVGMGRVEVRLPEGHEVNIKASSGIGKAKVDYPSAGENAAIRVKVDTGIGEASVKKRPAVDGAASAAQPAGTKPQRDAREASRRRRESEELRVLQMLEQGKVTTQEAADLIAALQESRFTFDED